MRVSLLVCCCAAIACAPHTPSSRPDSGPGCASALDTDEDGLSDCTELELGTLPEVRDTDGDGDSDGEEVACVSDPLDPEEVCYACGWPHNDPGTLSSTGARVGDTVENLELVDQCGERVNLWDLSGSWSLLFMTASWCGSCLEEARGFNDEQARVEAVTGLPFSFVTVVFQDSAGTLPEADEAARYAEAAGISGQPVFADPIARVLTATPYRGDALPGVCLLDPALVLVDCASGSDAVAAMVGLVEAEAALR